MWVAHVLGMVWCGGCAKIIVFGFLCVVCALLHEFAVSDASLMCGDKMRIQSGMGVTVMPFCPAGAPPVQAPGLEVALVASDIRPTVVGTQRCPLYGTRAGAFGASCYV